jgi:hypothetical protein
MTGATATQQLGFEEKQLDDPQILTALENWNSEKEGMDRARENFRAAEKVLQGLVTEKNLEAGTYRIGRWVVEVSEVAAHKRIRPAIAKT